MIRSNLQLLGGRRGTLLVLSITLLATALCALDRGALVARESDVAGKTAAGQSSAPCTAVHVRPQDQVWVFNTRCLGCPGGGWAGDPPWTVWKYDPQTPRWLNASADEFYQHDSADVVTAMYIHGNQIDSGLALSDGLDTYFQLAGQFEDEVPVRFVIWSWPSDKIRGPIKDGRSKADRSDSDAYYLGKFLARMRPDVRVGIIGYSFGARITAGGLHLLGGGSTLGLALPPAPRPRIRVAFWAAAEHDDWLLPGRYHGQALPQAEHWLITRNCCDPALVRYRWVEKCYNPVALGYSGMVGRNLLAPEIDARIEELDVTHLVGGTHDNDAYLYCEPIVRRTREVVLWH